jgi:5-bromo-4-chloroindolyl phosphate hydrolysis protein
MKAIITCKENCITVSTKNESETLYDTEIVDMIKDSTQAEFTDKVYDYFEEELEDAQINYKELNQICKKVYNSLK